MFKQLRLKNCYCCIIHIPIICIISVDWGGGEAIRLLFYVLFVSVALIDPEISSFFTNAALTFGDFYLFFLYA